MCRYYFQTKCKTIKPTKTPKALGCTFWQIFYVGTPSQEKWGRDRKENETGSINYVQAYFYTYFTDWGFDRVIWDRLYIIQYKIWNKNKNLIQSYTDLFHNCFIAAEPSPQAGAEGYSNKGAYDLNDCLMK